MWEGEARVRVWCGGIVACLHIRVMLRARALVCDQRFPRRQELNGSTEEERDWRKNETGGFGAKSGWRERLCDVIRVMAMFYSPMRRLKDMDPRSERNG